MPTAVSDPTAPVQPPPATRILSIDALRGLVMFTMIYVNDIAGAPHRLIPDWMVHFSDRHHGGSGMTFVDVVFPAFVFIVGMSIPFALGSRIARGEPLWKIAGHIVARTLALLAIGILMVNGESAARGTPDWSPELWSYTMFLSAIFAFCTISPPSAGPGRERFWKKFSLGLRGIGFAGMIYCAFTFHGRHDQAIITLSPFSIHTSWYGILGLIGWSYLVASVVFLLFRANRTALLGCLILLLCLYPADKSGLFENFPLSHFVGIGEMLGAHPAIAVAGLLLASILVAPEMRTNRARLSFTLLMVAGCAAGALLLSGLYGISKNNATPSWCLWSCAITAALWLGFYYLCDVASVKIVARPLAAAGSNVLLAYLLSEMLPNPFHLGGLEETGLLPAMACSIAWAGLLLLATVGLNRVGVRLKL